MVDQMEVYLDCEFIDNYLRWTNDKSGWIDEAYVTYVAGEKDSKYEWQATNLVRSIHMFSSRPIVVVVYGDAFVPPGSWLQLPNLIVYKMLPMKPGVSFNFNKLRAMISSRIVVGIQLDTDQIIFSGMDQVFNSTRREITAHHPWIIMPVHWMSRDEHPGNPYNAYAFKHYKGKHTMRWNHAHPTWTFWALAFLIDLLHERLLASMRPHTDMRVWSLPDAPSKGLMQLLHAGEKGQTVRRAVPSIWMSEDEDMMNVGLWRDGVDKAWCKFDLEPGLFINRYGLERSLYSDPQWYPDGVPLLFLSSHNTKNFEATDWLLMLLARCSKVPPKLRCPNPTRNDLPICRAGSSVEREARRHPSEYAAQVCCCVEPRWSQPIFWHGHWYSNMSEVPQLAPGGSGKSRRCVMP